MSERKRGNWKPASGIPAHGQRPPFQPGNLVPVRHGAQSPAKIAELAPEMIDRVRAAIVAERGCVTPGDEILAHRLGRVMAQLTLIDRYEDATGGPLDERGRSRPHADRADRYTGQLMKLCWSLGLGRMASARVFEAINGGGGGGDAWREAQARLRAKYGAGELPEGRSGDRTA